MFYLWLSSKEAVSETLSTAMWLVKMPGMVLFSNWTILATSSMQVLSYFALLNVLEFKMEQTDLKISNTIRRNSEEK